MKALLEHVRLRRPGPEFQLVSASLSADDDVVALWARAGDAEAFAAVTTQPGWATFPDSRVMRDVGAVVARHDSGGASIVSTISNLPVAHPLVQVLPSGRSLLVGARAYWREGGPEHNALLFGPDGDLLKEATFGDGIEHLQTTNSGDVWVGYFDEGVYGNYGWGSPGPTPIGARGIVRFDADLQLAWEYPSHVDQPWGSVDDCYALNVTDEATWACYYSDFPVVCIAGAVVTSWANEVGGAKALAVAGNQVALYGGYGEDRDRLVTGTLEDGHFNAESTTRLVMPDGSPIPRGSTVHGRGDSLHFIVDDRWLRADPFGMTLSRARLRRPSSTA